MFEFFELLWIRLVVQMRRVREGFFVVLKYYRDVGFLKLDLALLFLYPRSPFWISREFLRKKGEENIYQYGETPLTTLEKIVRECGITERDVVFEMGCGRGRGCFWINHFVGCKVVGVEFIPEFVEKAVGIKKRFGVEGVEFRCEDFLESDLSCASVIYLYGTCLKDEEIKRLIEKFAKLKSGKKIITVSFGLSDYTKELLFDEEKVFSAKFTWGIGEVYLQRRH